MRIFRRSISVLALVMAAGAIPAGAAGPQPVAISHGVAVGDVTPYSAVLWARTDRPATVHFEVSTDPGFRDRKAAVTVIAGEGTDLTAQTEITGLRPDTEYAFRAWASGSAGGLSPARLGRFRTAPEAGDDTPVRLLWGGDLGGQMYCRNSAIGGYAIFTEMAQLSPDFFVANGDMIYADGACPQDGPGDWENIPGSFPSIANPAVDWTNPAAVAEVYRAHWRYNREDPFLQEFLAGVPMVAQWDDHEVINDFGGPWTHWNSATVSRDGYPNLVEQGREAFFAYSPMAHAPADPNRIYRSFRWGSGLDLFVIDARSYRSRNDLPDSADKTLLGGEQLTWLVDGVTGSEAVWKVVSSDVPISIPTGSVTFGRDAWANGTETGGFETELFTFLAELDAADTENLVFITTDVHFAQTIRYAVDADGDGDELVFWEFVSGPLNAVRGNPRPLDPTLAPESLYAEGGTFNFGVLDVVPGSDGLFHLRTEIRDETGTVRPGSSFDLAPAG